MFDNQVVVRDLVVPLPTLSRTSPPLRIAHISDLHFRDWNDILQQVQDLLMSLEYDVLAFTGDFCLTPEHWKAAAKMCRRFFQPLNSRFGTFGVLGNHDNARLADQPDMPFQLLTNEHRTLDLGGSSLVLAGVDQAASRPGCVTAALAGAPANATTVLLAHYPSTIYDVPPDRVQLVLSGHTHAGQIRLPAMGCVWTNDRIPRQYAWGLHRVNDTLLHVTAGIGCSGPVPRRFRCPPEISLINLVGVETADDEAAATTPGVRESASSALETAKV